jgi:DNA-binding transcriptional LysR family regulator
VVHSYTVLPRDFPAGCDHEVLLNDPVLLAVHPRHAARLGLSDGAAADLARFATAPWLTPGPETSCYEMIQGACGAAGFVPASHARSSDFSVLTALAAAGAGVALVPRVALPAAPPPIGLHPLVRPVTRTISTAVRTGTARRPDLRQVLELLHRAASGPPFTASRP